MAYIKGGTTGALAEVDTTSKALRAMLVDKDGNALSGGLGRYAALVNVRQSAATGAPVGVWALRNANGTRTVVIESILLRCFFDGAAAATNMRYEIIKATAVSAMSGGSAVTAALKRTSESAPVSAAAMVLDTGITLTGATYAGAIHHMVCSRVTQTTTVHTGAPFELLDFTNPGGEPFELAINEALVIRSNVNSVVGDNIIGSVQFSER